MAPRNFQQTQPITTTLRMVLGLYAPSSCLRELVQNADDAKASKVEFVLDSNTYTGGPLLHQDLQDYQGPSLLAWNDSCFKESDFQSLSSVGDSLKHDDIATTGKFGLGFNSVFHYTDMPSILSDETLLFLDPHHSWSKKIGQPGGPAWNIVEDNLKEVGNHLAAFAKCRNIEPGKPFNGTLIRIPLRTPAQALQSKIKPQASTVDEVKEALEDFCQEILSGGLVFMKNVRSVSVKFNEELLMRATILPEESSHRSLQNRIPDDFVGMYGTLQQAKDSVHRTYQVGVQYEGRDSVKEEKYLIQSLMAPSCGDPKIDSWARERKLFPWVAVAAPLTSNLKLFAPSLFSTLRLPIQHYQPIHIHGLFAISQDRKSICLEERDEATEWNRWLSDTVIIDCYTKLLEKLASLIGEKSFCFWPKRISAENANSLSGIVTKFFWQRVPTLRDARLFPLRQNIDFGNRKQGFAVKNFGTLHACTSITDAISDLLCDETSRILAPLFEKLKLPLVRLPANIDSKLKDVKKLNSSYLSTLFKKGRNCNALEEFLRTFRTDVEKMQAYTALLDILTEVPQQDQPSLQTLAGCRILARRNLQAPLGLLRLSKDADDQKYLYWYFDMTSEEQELFSFAANHIIIKDFQNSSCFSPLEFDNLQNSWLKIISKFKQSELNVRKIEEKDIGYLLTLPESPTRLDHSDWFRQTWTADFWKYCNRKFGCRESGCSPWPIKKILENAALYDHGIYRVAGPSKARFITPREFDTMPCIVQPKDTRVFEICSQLADITYVDPIYLPTVLACEQGNQSAEFAQLLSAVKRMESSKGTSATLFEGSSSQKLSREPLLDLLVAFLEGFESYSGVPHMYNIRRLALWPRIDRPGHHALPPFIGVEDAHFCEHSAMFVPWAKDLQSFVDPSSVSSYKRTLEKLNINLMAVSDMWTRIEKYLPHSLPNEAAVSSLVDLLQCLEIHDINFTSPLALDGTRTFRQANSLFDHEDTMFQAAFRQEVDHRYLHPKLRHMRSFFVSNGLRTSGFRSNNMTETTFSECLTAVGHCSKSPSFHEQASVVASYLEYEKYGFRSWSTSTWTLVSEARIFLVCQNVSDIPVYRQPRMNQLAKESSHCCLQEVAKTQYLAITWSQKKQLQTPPTSGVFDFLPTGGPPSLYTVYDHLNFLVSICGDVRQNDVSNYVEDLKACYRFLTDDSGAARGLPGIKDAHIWLNLDKTDKSSIHEKELLNLLPANSICLNEPGGGLDSLPNVQVARDLLLPYASLLKALGCRKEVLRAPPTITTPDESPSAKIYRTIEQNRETSDYTDVIFEAQGQTIKAHKEFLTTASKKWKAQFSGPWAEHARNVVIPVEMDFKTLSTLVKHAYLGIFEGSQVKANMAEDEVTAVVNEYLDILVAADEFMMTDLHNQVEVYFLTNMSYLVRFWTVDAIKERSSAANAGRLREVCEGYLIDNTHFVDLYRKQNAEDEAL